MSTAETNFEHFSSPSSTVGGKRRARVLNDYTGGVGELSLKADEVILVEGSGSLDPAWMIGERGAEKGKVPVAYLEILN